MIIFTLHTCSFCFNNSSANISNLLPIWEHGNWFLCDFLPPCWCCWLCHLTYWTSQRCPMGQPQLAHSCCLFSWNFLPHSSCHGVSASLFSLLFYFLDLHFSLNVFIYINLFSTVSVSDWLVKKFNLVGPIRTW